MIAESNSQPGWSLRLVKGLALVAVGVLVGRLSGELPQAHADVRQGERRQAFLSGGERSVEVLEEISKKLTTIDERLARFEKAISPENLPDKR